MTIKELYEYAVKNGLENKKARVQYRDGGGDYYGWDDLGEEDGAYGYGVVYNEKEDVVYL